MKTINDLISEHAFFKNLSEEDRMTISGCGKNIHIKKGAFLVHEGEEADSFYLIRSGLVNVEIFVPPIGNRVIQTLRQGDIAGWSWIFPPYRWTFDLKVSEELSAIALDGKCLRAKCEQDYRLGYLLMKQFAQIMSERVRASRIQNLDVYGGFQQS